MCRRTKGGSGSVPSGLLVDANHAIKITVAQKPLVSGVLCAGAEYQGIYRRILDAEASRKKTRRKSAARYASG